MTVVFYGAAAVAAALGSGVLAALLLVVAAIFAATGTAAVAVATWTAGLAAGLVWLGGSPRRFALPIAGAAAAVGAGVADNAAAVTGLWVASTLAVLAAARPDDEPTRRWATAFALADLGLVAAVVLGSAKGFAAWPSTGRPVVFVLLLATAATKALLAAGPRTDDRSAAFLVVRTQAVVGAVLAVGASPRSGLEVVIVVATVAFASVPLLATDVVTDLVQEVSLVAITIAAAALGWGPAGWAWGALAAGTLVHHLRVSSSRTSVRTATSLVARGAVIGVPFLPVVVAELEGVLRAQPWLGAIVVPALVLGLGARVRRLPRTRLRRAPRLAELVPLLFVALAVVLGLWPGSVTAPRPPGGAPIAWVPPIGVIVIVVAAGVGAAFPAFAAGPARVPRHEARPLPSLPFAELAARRWVLEGLALVLCLVAGLLWLVGAIRGFL